MAHFIAPFVGHDVPVAAVPLVHLHWFAGHEPADNRYPDLHEAHFETPLIGHEVSIAPVPSAHLHLFEAHELPDR